MLTLGGAGAAAGRRADRSPPAEFPPPAPDPIRAAPAGSTAAPDAHPAPRHLLRPTMILSVFLIVLLGLLAAGHADRRSRS